MSIVYTIGYEGTDIEKFVATLKAVGVRTLADVRAVALSRKKGFSKTALRERLEAEGIEYRHFVALGDPKPGREAARAGRIAEFKRVYASHLKKPEAETALLQMADQAKDASLCLLCFERDPKTCHRAIVAARLKTHGLEVIDLFGDDPGRYVRHAAKLPRRNPGQGRPQPQPEVRRDGLLRWGNR